MKESFFILILGVLIASCGRNGTTEKDKKEVVPLTTYNVDTASSTIKWQREVENKVENKQVSFLGVTATVNIDNASFSSEGTLPVLGGKIEYRGDSLQSLNLLVDFTMIRLFSKSSVQAISSEKFPPSTVQITKIRRDTTEGSYILSGNLTMKDKTGPVEMHSFIEKKDTSTVVMKGHMKLQTLDWPIREEADPSRIQKDLITLEMDLVFSKVKF